MRTVILKNIGNEGPGTISKYLEDNSMPFDILEPEDIDSLATLEGYSALVVLGGPMAVYEISDYPQISASLGLIKSALKRDMKVLGVCLGAQLMAHALGARVYKGKAPETGWMDIELTEDGASDPLLGTLVDPDSRIANVFQLHGDTFDIPEGAVRLAGSSVCPNQAFRVGTNAYALQFHLEMTRDKVIEWAKNEPTLLDSALSDIEYETYLKRANDLYGRFFGNS